MIIVTGATGFIGSNIVIELNRRGRQDIVCSDYQRGQHLEDAKFARFLHKDLLLQWLYLNHSKVEVVVHMGACTDTTSTDRDMMMEENYDYSKAVWLFCSIYRKRLVYASSAATYGDGSMGFDDDYDPKGLEPLNVYAESKQRFDLWALRQASSPPSWAGLKFFNVYGPREQHKGKMASMVWHAFRQIRRNGYVELFDGDARRAVRDFVYVGDVVDVVLFFAGRKRFKSGLYNVGSGCARTFDDAVDAVFESLGMEPVIEYFPMPKSMVGKYQFVTEAKLDKLRKAGYKKQFRTLEQSMEEYERYVDSL